MSYDSLFFMKDIIIVLLIFAIIAAMMKIRKLKDILEHEKRKRSMPLMAMEVNTDKDSGVFLINDSYCYAKNIDIDDLDVIVDYGFKKHITLKFPTLELLKPSARIKLDYRVFNGPNDVTDMHSLNILNHFSDAPIEMHLRYRNFEDSPFKAIIGPEKNQYITKEVTALEK